MIIELSIGAVIDTQKIKFISTIMNFEFNVIYGSNFESGKIVFNCSNLKLSIDELYKLHREIKDIFLNENNQINKS